MSQIAQKTVYSLFDKLETARFSSQELDEKFLELHKMLHKIKKKNVKTIFLFTIFLNNNKKRSKKKNHMGFFL